MVGPNGAVKTTLLEVMRGLLPAASGTLIGRDALLAPAERKRAMFYLPEATPPTLPNLPAGILDCLKPNGDCLTVRANALENNLVLWKFEKGRLSSVNGCATRPRRPRPGMISRS